MPAQSYLRLRVVVTACVALFGLVATAPVVHGEGLVRVAAAPVANDDVDALGSEQQQIQLAQVLGPFDSSPRLGDLNWSTAGRETEPGREEYPHIFSTDVWNPRRFFYTNRPNMLNMPVDDKFDAMKLINTDRPDFTDVATVVGRGVTQVETGWSYRYHTDPGQTYARNTVPEALVRVGTSDRFELRMKTNLGYTSTRYSDPGTGQSQNVEGFGDLNLGFKYILHDQDDWIPLQTFVGRMDVPTGNSPYSAQTVQPGFSYIYNWQVRKWWFFRGNTGVDWLTTPNPVFGLPGQGIVDYQRGYNVLGSQSVSSYFQIAPRLGMYVEWFMFMHRGLADNRPDHFHNYGWYYYITPNFQLDARIGWRVGGTIDEWFTGAGVSWRMGPNGIGGKRKTTEQ
ncbi:MAG: transporter [Planctomycetes bacterium]|nr:transporter [Planctomycetota bacterium]